MKDSINFKELIGWVDSFPAKRELFYELGFTLPKLALDSIESIRVRATGELPYDNYLDEVFRERLCLADHWSYTSRQNLSAVERSSYVDSLVTALRDGRIDIPDHFPLHLVLDPNDIYLVNKLHERAFVESYYSPLSAQKNIEAAKCWQYFETTTTVPRSPTVKSLTKLFDFFARKAGFDGVNKLTGTDPHIILKAEISGTKIPLYLVWGDPSALKRTGTLNLFFAIGDLSAKRFVLENVLPGSHMYSSNIFSAPLAALCVNVHINFLKILAS